MPVPTRQLSDPFAKFGKFDAASVVPADSGLNVGGGGGNAGKTPGADPGRGAPKANMSPLH